jgi:hypothetical protein
MNGRNGVCWPSAEQFPNNTKARSFTNALLELMHEARLTHAWLCDDVDNTEF